MARARSPDNLAFTERNSPGSEFLLMRAALMAATRLLRSSPATELAAICEPVDQQSQSLAERVKVRAGSAGMHENEARSVIPFGWMHGDHEQLPDDDTLLEVAPLWTNECDGQYDLAPADAITVKARDAKRLRKRDDDGIGIAVIVHLARRWRAPRRQVSGNPCLGSHTTSTT